MDDDLPTRILVVERFIRNCKSKFGWSCSPGDVVMDVGCGEHGVCGKAMLKYFPDTRIIFMDKIPAALYTLRATSGLDATYEIADIEDRDSIRRFEGKMNKVVCTYVFQQLDNKEETFRNIYRLLKPGGEAAILFLIKNPIDDWLPEMLKVPKWKALQTHQYKDEEYLGEEAEVHCREFVESIGFKVVDCTEKKRKIPPTDAFKSKEAFNKLSGDFFQVGTELLKEFQEESFQVLQQISVRDEEGKIFYRVTELHLVLLKPAEDPGLKKD